jgi:hypothetical protein
MGAPGSGMKAAEQPTAEALLTAFKTIPAAERRKHASVLNYWLSIRGDKEFPPLHDLDPLEPGVVIAAGLVEVDAEHSAGAAGADHRGMAAVFFHPFADGVVIGRGLCARHAGSPWQVADIRDTNDQTSDPVPAPQWRAALDHRLRKRRRVMPFR